MPDRDVVLAKVATIRKCLDRIREVTDLDPEKLEDINRQYIKGENDGIPEYCRF
ncbi:MAG: hypothetical protein PWR02_138 [Synergistales bacterium]|jgi:hypothetical protein|nr:hypothetical protein [Synergistales bacterium]